MKNIAIFGSTGSIGVNSINIIRNFPDLFKIRCLSTNKNIDLLLEQCETIKPETVIISDENAYKKFKDRCSRNLEVLFGKDAMNDVLSRGNIDLLVNSLVGFSGLAPTLTAIENGIDIALANKESLVTAGALIMPLLKEKHVNLSPIDSEHSAILQCLIGEEKDSIEKLILTASGGPFFHTGKDEFEKITIEQALNHPNWKMGSKITIDSATMMNKGLEVIEARWLFDITAENIEVIIHPQSIIHSMVEFKDGSIKAQLGIPDMKIPIQYALTYPKRLPLKIKTLDFVKLKHLQFFEPDLDKFVCLKIAYDAIKAGGIVPTIMNGANEIAVNLFLNHRIKFTDIPKIIIESIERFDNNIELNLSNIFLVDSNIREYLNKKYN